MLGFALQVSQKDKEIENLEKNLKQLREIMKRQPGAEEAKMIPIYQESLRQKSNQMKAMANELNLYQQQVKIIYKKKIKFLIGQRNEIRNGNTEKRGAGDQKEVFLSKEERTDYKGERIRKRKIIKFEIF